MHTTTVNATDLKKNISEILNMVYYEKRVAIVERHGKPLVKIIPIIREEIISKANNNPEKYFATLPDFSTVNIRPLRGSIKGKLVSKKKMERVRKINPAQELLNLAKKIEKIENTHPSSYPTDWSINHDYYLYGAPKRKP